ncbi:hypothetical protein TrLO_g5067 [Triparma laevis f. longispina]|uniref:Uncharacterized protein n=1 Tax=Triparma laevis f. longispina TaxID=1714387 RepID=A0A9W7DNC4_9STRA|nr:hypothetical protein TrLO_g5067 [Triparma laevis f. longispina]
MAKVKYNFHGPALTKPFSISVYATTGKKKPTAALTLQSALIQIRKQIRLLREDIDTKEELAIESSEKNIIPQLKWIEGIDPPSSTLQGFSFRVRGKYSLEEENAETYWDNPNVVPEEEERSLDSAPASLATRQLSLEQQLKEPLLDSTRTSSAGSFFDRPSPQKPENRKSGLPRANEMKVILGIRDTDEPLMPNFISEVVLDKLNLSTTSTDLDKSMSAPTIDKHITSLLQYRILTHLASERLFLVWQRCSCTLVSGAFTLLSIAMEHERFLYTDCKPKPGGDDDDPDNDGDDKVQQTNDNDDNFVPTDDDCGGRGVISESWERNGLFFAMFGAGVVLFVCLISINYWGAKTFRRARNWLHGDGGAHIILLEDNEINLIFAAVFAVCTSTFVAFFAQSMYFIEEADY